MIKKEFLTERISTYGIFKDEEYQNPNIIQKIEVLSDDVNQCKIYFKDGNVYSMEKFYPRDIIEICPVKYVDKSSLYSKDMRDIIFEVTPYEEYVIPFGYCQFYATSTNDYDDEPNCDYIWDPNAKTIIIRATKRIPKNTKLILKL